MHKTLGLPNPCDSGTVQALKEAAKRILSKPVRKKEPITPSDLRKMAKHLADASLLDLRTLTVALLSYAGFLRFDEVSKIRSEFISFRPSYVKIFIDKSKSDQHKVGDYVVIAKTGSATCPVEALKKYLFKAKVGRKGYIFRGMQKVRNGHVLRRADKAVSYSSLRRDILGAVSRIGLEKSRFGLHSMRRGGATRAARNGVNDRLFKKHGRWRSERAKDGYAAETLRAMLSVSRNLGI